MSMQWCINDKFRFPCQKMRTFISYSSTSSGHQRHPSVALYKLSKLFEWRESQSTERKSYNQAGQIQNWTHQSKHMMLLWSACLLTNPHSSTDRSGGHFEQWDSPETCCLHHWTSSSTPAIVPLQFLAYETLLPHSAASKPCSVKMWPGMDACWCTPSPKLASLCSCTGEWGNPCPQCPQAVHWPNLASENFTNASLCPSSCWQ